MNFSRVVDGDMTCTACPVNNGREELCEKCFELKRKKMRICAYCKEDIPIEDREAGSVYSPKWEALGFQSPTRYYHKSKGCHAKDQFSHEG